MIQNSPQSNVEGNFFQNNLQVDQTSEAKRRIIETKYSCDLTLNVLNKSIMNKDNRASILTGSRDHLINFINDVLKLYGQVKYQLDTNKEEYKHISKLAGYFSNIFSLNNEIFTTNSNTNELEKRYRELYLDFVTIYDELNVFLTNQRITNYGVEKVDYTKISEFEFKWDEWKNEFKNKPVVKK